MKIQQQITDKLTTALTPEHLEVINESHMHAVKPGSESHFKVVIVTDQFNDLSMLQQHRRVNEVLKEELSGLIHALALHTYTPEQWAQQQGNVPESPLCQGGSKHQ